MPETVEYVVIVSKARSKDSQVLVITATTEQEKPVVAAKQEYGNEYQLWEKRQVRANDSNVYALVNKKTGTCLGRANASNGSKIVLGTVAEAKINDFYAWRDDNVPGTHNAIKSNADWEQKLNIPGNGPYSSGQGLVTWEWSRGQQNELWVCVPDSKLITLTRMDFQMDQASILKSVPVVSSKQLVTNLTAHEQTETVTFSVTKGKTYSFKREHGLKISEGITFSAGLPLVGETEVEIVVEGTHTYSEDHTEEETEEVTLEIPVTVPAQSAVTVSAIMLQGIIDVPYTATFEIKYPDATFTEKASGIFKGVNTFTVTTEFKPVESEKAKT
ncbi:hypothetical protein FHS18_000869 [Paenibacillus phyllosphaerae]|uniref:Uncharacterized protein n=1 Tax=Paenibacillus phyllosphaerae TaxID=274593 RepID=A0A7W5AUB8_9BACL|nr:ETX/MTX2 family pore-forming toxin [Paenibacillus phyllosphaerae]MBB3108817.1 hypothetical protein [Paenibacillus phyllosphaerae]